MAKQSKKRKYPRLPNGFGSIKYLGKNRTNPFGVYPPVTEFDEDGRPKVQKALAYVDDWFYGFSILTDYNQVRKAASTLDADSDRKTFEEIYHEYYRYKYETSKRKYSDASKYSTKTAFNNLLKMMSMVFPFLKKNYRFCGNIRMIPLPNSFLSCATPDTALQLTGRLK